MLENFWKVNSVKTINGTPTNVIWETLYINPSHIISITESKFHKGFIFVQTSNHFNFFTNNSISL